MQVPLFDADPGHVDAAAQGAHTVIVVVPLSAYAKFGMTSIPRIAAANPKPLQMPDETRKIMEAFIFVWFLFREQKWRESAARSMMLLRRHADTEPRVIRMVLDQVEGVFPGTAGVSCKLLGSRFRTTVFGTDMVHARDQIVLRGDRPCLLSSGCGYLYIIRFKHFDARLD